MTRDEVASALIVIFTIALMFGINIGESVFPSAPKIILFGFCAMGATVLWRMGIFALVGKILLGLIVVGIILWLISDK